VTAWIALLLVGLMEITWALGFKYSDGCTRLWPSISTVTALGLSFVFLSLSLKSVPFGTAYPVWAGSGAAVRQSSACCCSKNVPHRLHCPDRSRRDWQLPSDAIAIVHRSDGSGTTFL
jgi:multidrug transporter EmrE-like cation transporter